MCFNGRGSRCLPTWADSTNDTTAVNKTRRNELFRFIGASAFLGPLSNIISPRILADPILLRPNFEMRRPRPMGTGISVFAIPAGIDYPTASVGAVFFILLSIPEWKCPELPPRGTVKPESASFQQFLPHLTIPLIPSPGLLPCRAASPPASDTPHRVYRRPRRLPIILGKRRCLPLMAFSPTINLGNGRERHLTSAIVQRGCAARTETLKKGIL